MVGLSGHPPGPDRLRDILALIRRGLPLERDWSPRGQGQEQVPHVEKVETQELSNIELLESLSVLGTYRSVLRFNGPCG